MMKMAGMKRPSGFQVDDVDKFDKEFKLRQHQRNGSVTRHNSKTGSKEVFDGGYESPDSYELSTKVSTRTRSQTTWGRGHQRNKHSTGYQLSGSDHPLEIIDPEMDEYEEADAEVGHSAKSCKFDAYYELDLQPFKINAH